MTVTRVKHKEIADRLTEGRWRKVGDYGTERSAEAMMSRIRYGRVPAYVGLPLRVKIRGGVQVWVKLDGTVQPVVEAKTQ